MNRPKNVILFVCFVFASLIARPQQDVVFSQYLFDQLTVNPARAGNADGIQTNLIHRSQWSMLDGGITAQSLTSHMPLSFNRFGLGIKAYSESVDGFKQASGHVVGSYKINLYKGFLSYGMEVGFLSSRFDQERFNVKNTLDPALLELNQSSSFDLGAGLYFQRDNFFVGASVSHLTARGKQTETGVQKVGLHRHYYGFGGYKIRWHQQYYFTISSYFKYVAPGISQVDVAIHAFITEKAWLGVSSRSSGDITIQAGVNLKGFSRKIVNPLLLGYTYDIVNRHASVLSPASHELIVSYCFQPRPRLSRLLKRKPVASPTFFK